MAKEVDYKALIDKNKRVREFGEKRLLARNAKEFKLSSDDLKGHLSKDEGEKPEDRGKKYTFGLVTLDDNIDRNNTRGAYKVFSLMGDSLDNEKGMTKEEVEKYQKALAKRGYRLVNKLHKDHVYNVENEEILKYCDKHLGKKSSDPSGLEKAITVISMLSVVLGISIGYPALTGNVIAENVRNSAFSGLALFVVGLMGVFLANKK